MKTKLFYDMEVFKSDTLIVFKNPDGSIAGVFWNNRDRKTQEEPSGFEGIPDLIKDKQLPLRRLHPEPDDESGNIDAVCHQSQQRQDYRR